MNGGTMLMQNDANFSAAALAMSGGAMTLRNGANFLSATSSINNGTILLQNNTTFSATSSFDLNAPATMRFEGGFLNAGTLSGSGTYSFNLNVYDFSSAEKRVQGVIQATGDIDVENANFYLELFGGYQEETIALVKQTGAGKLTGGAVAKAQIEAYSSSLWDYIVDLADESIYLTSRLNGKSFTDDADSENAEVKRGLNELSPANNAAATRQMLRSATQQFNSALDQVFGDTFALQIAARSLDFIFSDLRDRQLTGFVKAYGGWGSQVTVGRTAGYDFGGVGVLAGIGYKFAPEVEIGGIIGYGWQHVDIRQRYAESRANTLRLGLYGNYQWDNFYVNTAPTAGIHLLHSERRFETMRFDLAKNDRTGADFSWHNRAGYTHEAPFGIFITPSVALSATYFHEPSYTETGAAAANLEIGDNDSWSLLQATELRFGKVFRVGEWGVLPEIWGAWEHEYFASRGITAGYAARPDYTAPIRVREIAPDRALFGAGITTLLRDKYEMYGRAEQHLWDGGTSTNFTFGASMKW
jgi:uncharacterized protein with beta-barrel porin domain